jgi:hypothetical protein
VPVCGAVSWASASDDVSTGESTAKLNAASPKKENALRRDNSSDVIFWLISTSLWIGRPAIKLERGGDGNFVHGLAVHIAVCVDGADVHRETRFNFQCFGSVEMLPQAIGFALLVRA